MTDLRFSPQFYSQRDPHWSWRPLGPGPKRIGDIGCTTTCLGMLADLDPQLTSDRISRANGYTTKQQYPKLAPQLILWSQAAQALGMGFDGRYSSYDNDKVLKTISAYGACLVEVDFDGIVATPNDRHWVVFLGNKQLFDPWSLKGMREPTSKYPKLKGFVVLRPQ